MIRTWLQKTWIHHRSKHYLHHQLAKDLFQALWFSINAIEKLILPNGRRAASLPICLVVGPAQSGKTALITASAIQTSSSLAINSTYQPMPGRAMPSYYLSYQSLFIEVPQYYFINESTKQIPYLQQLLICWRKAGYLKRLDQVIFTISVTKLFQLQCATNPTHLFEEFWHALQILLSQVTARPINFICVVTELDKLPGFQEFFADLSLEERQQYFGFAIKSTGSVLNSFQQQAIHLMKRLQRRMLWRCQSEIMVTRRLLVAEFPKQFEAMLYALKEWLVPLAALQNTLPQMHWKACFFTSALQGGGALDWLWSKTAFNVSELPVIRHTLPMVSKERPYFIRQIFQLLKSLHSIQPPLRMGSTTHTVKKKAYLAFAKRWLKQKKLWFLVSLPVALVVFTSWHVAHVLNVRDDLAFKIWQSSNAPQLLQHFVAYEAPYLPTHLQESIARSELLQRVVDRNARDYLNQHWQTEVLAYYQKNLVGRYPLNPSAIQEVSWQTFNQFYGPNGILQKFIQKYLTSSLVQKHLADPKVFAQLVMHLMQLNNDFYWQAKPHLVFTLYPNLTGRDIKSVTISFQKTKMLIKPNVLSAATVQWNAELADMPAGLAIEWNNAPARSQFFAGHWGWLRFLQSFKWEKGDNANSYILISAWPAFRLQLTTETPMYEFFELLPQLSDVPTTW